MEDLVSIVLPTYNRGYIIKECIDNLLQQTYTNLEIIVVDDGSEDNTEKRIKFYRDSRVHYLYQRHQGACAARNAGIISSKGKYVAFQDSDDLWDRNKVQRQINVIKNTGTDIVFCKRTLDNTRQPAPIHIREGVVDISKVSLLNISTQTILGRIEVFRNVKFDVAMPRFQDLELLIRLSQNYKIYCMDECLVNVRIQKNSISNNMEKRIVAGELILDKDAKILNSIILTKVDLMKMVGFGKACMGKNDRDIYREIYCITKRKKDLMKMVLAYIHILDKVYRIKYARDSEH